MKDTLGVKKVFILDDKELYGKGVADAFEAAAKDAGLTVAGHEGWDKDAQNYRALMTKIKASGADGIYIGGVSANNGGQLVKDKVADRRRQRRRSSCSSPTASCSPRSSRRRARRTSRARSAPLRRSRREQADRRRARSSSTTSVAAESGKPSEVYTVYAAAAAQVAARRDRRSDGTREDVSRSCSRRTSPTRVVGALDVQRERRPGRRHRVRLQGESNGDWEFAGRRSRSS